jgi:hypothetical protein
MRPPNGALERLHSPEQSPPFRLVPPKLILPMLPSGNKNGWHSDCSPPEGTLGHGRWCTRNKFVDLHDRRTGNLFRLTKVA